MCSWFLLLKFSAHVTLVYIRQIREGNKEGIGRGTKKTSSLFPFSLCAHFSQLEAQPISHDRLLET